MVWYIEPQTRTARSYTAIRKWTDIGPDGALLGGEVLPGFELPLPSCLPEWKGRRNDVPMVRMLQGSLYMRVSGEKELSAISLEQLDALTAGLQEKLRGRTPCVVRRRPENASGRREWLLTSVIIEAQSRTLTV
jgi:hypothetical protein